MQLNLLRYLFSDAINEPNEESRVGVFWCHASCGCYDEFFSMLKIIFYNEKLTLISSSECTIAKGKKGFLIKDSDGEEDVYLHDEIVFLIDLWDKGLKIVPNIIDLDPQEKV